MTFAEAKVEYCRIKNLLKDNRISHEEYMGRINDLKIQDEAGNWYQINEADGSWMLWDGQAWTSYSVPKVKGREAVVSGAPESLWKLLVSMVKGFFHNIPKAIIFQLIKLGAVFLVVFFIHAYLLVVRNEGFNVDWNNPYAAITKLKGVDFAVSAFWGFFAFFLTVLLTRVIKGPVKFIKEIATTPVYIFKSFKESGLAGLTALLGGMALGLLSFILIKSPYLFVLYALMIILSLTKQKKGMLLLALKLAWQDWHRSFKTKKFGQKPDIGAMSIFILGISIGMLIVPNLPLKPYSPFVVAALMIALSILLRTKKVSPSAAMMVLSFFAFNLVLFRYQGVFADDVGWVEGGGTLGGVLKSPGVGKALASGLGPGAAAAAGTLVGSFVPEVEVPVDDAGTEAADLEYGLDADDPEGTVIHKNPDGSIVKEFPDGTIAVKHPDGNITISCPDGTTGIRYPDGTEHITNPDGSVQTNYPDGTAERTDPDGTVVKLGLDGVQTIYSPDGTYAKVYPNGDFEFSEPDGSYKVLDPDNNVIKAGNAEGYTMDFNPDGTQVMHSPYGGSVTVDDDGNLIKGSLTNKDGTEYTFDGDKINAKSPDGSTFELDKANGTMTVNGSDGAKLNVNSNTGEVDASFPDGTHLKVDSSGNVSGYDAESGLEFKLNKDGTASVWDKDGNSLNCNSDGSGELKYANGVTISQQSDGTAVLKLPDGRELTANTDGTHVMNAPDGTEAVRSADGSVVITKPDGTVENYNAGEFEKMIKMKNPEG